MSDTVWYHLSSLTMEGCGLSKGEYERARNNWLCTGCGQPKPGIGAMDATLEAPPENIPLSQVFGVGLGLIRRDLLDALGRDTATRDLLLGRVFGPDGRPCDEFSTFRGTATLFIRGDESSSTRICELCGRRLYHPHGRRHLVVRPPSEHSIFESQFHQLIVTPEIYDRVKQRQWRKLGVDRLKVLDQPRDGLPIF